MSRTRKLAAEFDAGTQPPWTPEPALGNSPGTGIRAALDSVAYPAHHLDFETLGSAIPRYPNAMVELRKALRATARR